MADVTIEANFKVTGTASARERGKRIDERAIVLLAAQIGGDEPLARAIYKAAFALPFIIQMAVDQIEKEDHGKEETRSG